MLVSIFECHYDLILVKTTIFNDFKYSPSFFKETDAYHSMELYGYSASSYTFCSRLRVKGLLGH